MLAWWGVIPAVVFVVVEIYFGSAVAKNRATGPDTQVSYLMGVIFAGLLISTVIGWIAYRLLRRSQVAGTVAFSAILALFCLSVLTITGVVPGLARRGSTQSAAGGRASFGDFSVVTPSGWASTTPDRQKTAAMFLLGDESLQNARALIKIDAGKCQFENGREAVAAFAGGKMTPTAISLGDNEAFQIEMPAGGGMSRPRFVAASVRDHKLYLIMGAGADDVDLAGAFQQIINTWRWEVAP